MNYQGLVKKSWVAYYHFKRKKNSDIYVPANLKICLHYKPTKEKEIDRNFIQKTFDILHKKMFNSSTILAIPLNSGGRSVPLKYRACKSQIFREDALLLIASGS
jgi:hypothetical protein